MKLAVITPYWKSNLGGGINTYTVGFVNSVKKSKDIKIEIASIHGTGEITHRIPKRTISSILGTIKVLNKMKPDIIQVHNEWPLLLGAAIYKTSNNIIC